MTFIEKQNSHCQNFTIPVLINRVEFIHITNNSLFCLPVFTLFHQMMLKKVRIIDFNNPS